MTMQIYRNLGGDSGVAAFEIGFDYIKVRFREGKYKEYTYDYSKAGQNAVEQMKHLALGGKGLNSFINTCVKNKYSSKIA